MITLTREEAQKMLDALNTVYGAPRYEAAKILRAKLIKPEPEREQCDMPCIEDDGCPTEKAVLQRFWRKHRQLEPEPVAYRARVDGMWFTAEKKEKLKHELNKAHINADIEPLYTAPPQRKEWVGLTDEEIDVIGRDKWVGWPSYDGEFTYIYRLLEAKLKEKNGF